MWNRIICFLILVFLGMILVQINTLIKLRIDESVFVRLTKITENLVARFFTDDLQQEEEFRILFVGDMMFDRDVRKIALDKGRDYTLSCVADWLKEFDLVVGNLEGPITDSNSVSLGSVVGSPSNFVFTFATSTADILAENNIRLVNIGNNHINNFGTNGVVSTKKYLTNAGVNYFGDDVYRKGRLSFVSFNQFGGLSATTTAKQIAEEKLQNQTVILYTHWGEEYQTTPTYIKHRAEQFVEAGADIIIGSHPHVVVPMAHVKGVPVYYSLGNFIFDQYWESSVKTGMTLEVVLFEDKISTTTEYVIDIGKGGRPCKRVSVY